MGIEEHPGWSWNTDLRRPYGRFMDLQQSGIIDFHVHAVERGLVPDHVFNRVRMQQRQPHLLLESMDRFGIAKSVVLATDWPAHGFKVTNEYVAALVDKHPQRFIGFGCVDPTTGEEAAKNVYRLVEELGLRGLKFHTATQYFYPDDERCFPTYEAAEKLGIPIIFHTGAAPAGATTERILRYKFTNPIHLDDVVRSFPKLRVVMAHMGGGYFFEAFAVAASSKSVYMDTTDADLIGCVFQPWRITFTQLLERALQLVGVERIVFGSEGGHGCLERNLNLVKGAFTELGLDEEERNLILRGNAQRLLKPPAEDKDELLGNVHKADIKG